MASKQPGMPQDPIRRPAASRCRWTTIPWKLSVMCRPVLTALVLALSLPTIGRAAANNGAMPGDRILLVPASGTPARGFTSNLGQWDERARFVARRGTATVIVSDDGLWIRVFERASSRDPLEDVSRPEVMRVVDFHVVISERHRMEIQPFDAGAGYSNFFVGDESRWRARVPSYSRIRLQIDGSTSAIELVDETDGIYLDTGTGSRTQVASLRCERWDTHGRSPSDITAIGRATLLAGPLSVVSEPTDASAPRRRTGTGIAAGASNGVTLAYSSMLGGSGFEICRGIVNTGASTVVVGETDSFDFPLTPGVVDDVFETGDAFVTRFAPDGNVLEFSTFLGGIADDSAQAVTVGPDGSIYVAGYFNGLSFPTTPGAFDQTTNGGIFDGFLARISSAGDALVYSTILGGGENDIVKAVRVDQAGNAYLTGYTYSTDFPTTPGAFDSDLSGSSGFNAFVTKVTSTGGDLHYSTYFGGTSTTDAQGVAVDSTGAAYIIGRASLGVFPATPGAFDFSPNGNWDVYVAKLLPDGSDVAFATLIGGNNIDEGRAIAVDASGSAYITGWTSSPNFPSTPGAFDPTAIAGEDIFVSKLDPKGAALEYSTFVGHAGLDRGYSLAVTAAGEAWVAGQTGSTLFPVTPDAFDPVGNGDTVLFGLSADGSALLYSTAFGGSSGVQEIAYGIDVDDAGSVVVCGTTTSTDFPVTPGAADPAAGGFAKGFVAKFNAHWPDLGGAAPGIAGPPALTGKGALYAGAPTTILLSDAAPDALMLAWLSFRSQPWNILGGTLHAYPVNLQVPRSSDASGSDALEFAWPAGIPSGLPFTLQYLIQDFSVPAQITLSNAVTARTP